MTFAEPLWLLTVLVPIGWTVWSWRRGEALARTFLKGSAFVLALLAFSEPRWNLPSSQIGVTLVAEGPNRAPGEPSRQQSALAEQLEAASGRHLVRTVTFGGAVSTATATSGPKNLEEALLVSIAASPEDSVPRLVLLSDGHDEAGALERVLYAARRRGVPVDTVPLHRPAASSLRLKSLTVPATAYTGERLTIELDVESPAATSATVELLAKGITMGKEEVQLERGLTPLRVQGRVRLEGPALIQGRITPGDEVPLEFESAIVLRRPHALIISSDPAQQDQHLSDVLRENGFDLLRMDAPPQQFGEYQLVVANNQDLQHWPQAAKEAISEFVLDGGGFLAIAGDRSLYERQEDAELDALEKALPATVAPPRSPEGTAVVLILDKSSSMEGRKMILARQSAIGVVENLRPIDQVGVLVFDNSHQWAVRLRRNSYPDETKKLIASVVADGGTQIAPALHEAFLRIQDSQALYKHILLLTDGISEEGDSMEIAQQARDLKVTISTIGLGQDVNRALLERVADEAEGKSYFLRDVAGLTQLVLRDVMEHTGSSMQEREVSPRVVEAAEFLTSVDLADAGPLLGWVRHEAKPGAQVLLEIDEEDPLLTRWQYGLGRSAVFASDAKDRWAQNWIAWPGFDSFWANLARDLLPRADRTLANARFDEAGGEIVAHYRIGPGREAPAEDLTAYFLGDEDRRAAPLKRVGPRLFEARAPAQGSGLVRVHVEPKSEAYPDVALVLPSRERSDRPPNEALLRRIAQVTGGTFRPEPEQVFQADGRTVATRVDLWPWLLFMTVLLNLAELMSRKGWLTPPRRWLARTGLSGAV